MFLTRELVLIFFGIKILLSIAAGTAVAFILHRWGPIYKPRLWAGSLFGVLGGFVGSVLTGWAWQRTEYSNGHPVDFRSWLAAREFSFPVLLTVCLLVCWQLGHMCRRHS